MLQKSIDRQAKEIISEGATEKERYGHLLDSVKGRDLEQEEKDRRQEVISRIHSNAEAGRARREKKRRNRGKSCKGLFAMWRIGIGETWMLFRTSIRSN